MEKTFCDGCGVQISEGTRSVASLVIMSKDLPDAEGDYCRECADVVEAAISEAFADD